MLKLNHIAQLLLLAAMLVVTSRAPAVALDETKPSKPLNLLSFGRDRAASPQKSRTAAPPVPVAQAASTPAWSAEDTGSGITGAVPASETPPPAPVRPAKPGSTTAPPKPAPAHAVAPVENEVALFCSSVTDPAVDARLAWQLKELAKAETQLREQIAEVEAKRAE